MTRNRPYLLRLAVPVLLLLIGKRRRRRTTTTKLLLQLLLLSSRWLLPIMPTKRRARTTTTVERRRPSRTTTLRGTTRSTVIMVIMGRSIHRRIRILLPTMATASPMWVTSQRRRRALRLLPLPRMTTPFLPIVVPIPRRPPVPISVQLRMRSSRTDHRTTTVVLV